MGSPRRCLLSFPFAAAMLAAVASAGAAAPETAAHRCKAGFKHALIAGKHECLKPGARCRSRHDTHYHRHGFHCHNNRLSRPTPPPPPPPPPPPQPRAADLTLAVAAAPDPVTAGAELTYTLTVQNAGPDAATAVRLSAQLAPTATLISAQTAQGSCTTAPALECALGTIPVTSSATLLVTVRPTAAGSLNSSFTASSTTTDPNSGNNTATRAVTVVAPAADVFIALTDTPDPIAVGATLTYTATVTNSGPAAATNVQASIALPATATFLSSSASQGNCAGGQTVQCTLGNLAAPTTATITVTARPTAAGTLTASASVTSTGLDPNTANNTVSATTTVTAAAPPPANCHPSYPDVCIRPPPPDLDCSQIPYRNFRVIYTVPDPDPHRFDADRDGIGCET